MSNSLKPFLVPLGIGLLAIFYFSSNSAENSGSTLGDVFLAEPSYPEEIGVFVETGTGWTRVASHQYEGMFGTYPTAKRLSVDQLPVVQNSAKIFFSGVPMDPSQVYWVRNVNAGRDWKGPLDPMPLSLRAVGDRSYEGTIEGMSPGVKNIYLKRGFSGMGHFIIIR